MQQLALDFGLAPLPSLDNFVSADNEAALAHVRLWTHNPLRAPVPTYLWGEGGCGKTHLLQGRGRQALRNQGASAFGWLDATVLAPTGVR
jgi:DnaA family protein